MYKHKIYLMPLKQHDTHLSEYTLLSVQKLVLHHCIILNMVLTNATNNYQSIDIWSFNHASVREGGNFFKICGSLEYTVKWSYLLFTLIN